MTKLTNLCTTFRLKFIENIPLSTKKYKFGQKTKIQAKTPLKLAFCSPFGTKKAKNHQKIGEITIWAQNVINFS